MREMRIARKMLYRDQDARHLITTDPLNTPGPSFPVRGGVLADALGYGKTCLAIALMDSTLSLNWSYEEKQQFRGLIPAPATLVVAPAHLVWQWEEEILQFVGNTFSMLVIDTVSKLKQQSTRDISSFDVIIVSRNVFDSPVYKARVAEIAGRMCTESGFLDWDKERGGKRFGGGAKGVVEKRAAIAKHSGLTEEENKKILKRLFEEEEEGGSSSQKSEGGGAGPAAKEGQGGKTPQKGRPKGKKNVNVPGPKRIVQKAVVVKGKLLLKKEAPSSSPPSFPGTGAASSSAAAPAIGQIVSKMNAAEEEQPPMINNPTYHLIPIESSSDISKIKDSAKPSRLYAPCAKYAASDLWAHEYETPFEDLRAATCIINKFCGGKFSQPFDFPVFEMFHFRRVVADELHEACAREDGKNFPYARPIVVVGEEREDLEDEYWASLSVGGGKGAVLGEEDHLSLKLEDHSSRDSLWDDLVGGQPEPLPAHILRIESEPAVVVEQTKKKSALDQWTALQKTLDEDRKNEKKRAQNAANAAKGASAATPFYKGGRSLISLSRIQSTYRWVLSGTMPLENPESLSHFFSFFHRGCAAIPGPAFADTQKTFDDFVRSNTLKKLEFSVEHKTVTVVQSLFEHAIYLEHYNSLKHQHLSGGADEDEFLDQFVGGNKLDTAVGGGALGVRERNDPQSRFYTRSLGPHTTLP